jgi:hypothetical protein
MLSSLETELQRQVGRYLDGAQNIDAFMDWFGPFIWETSGTGDPVMVSVDRLDLHLMEYTSGDRTEDELRALFGSIVPSLSQSPYRSTAHTVMRKLKLGEEPTEDVTRRFQILQGPTTALDRPQLAVSA